MIRFRWTSYTKTLDTFSESACRLNLFVYHAMATQRPPAFTVISARDITLFCVQPTFVEILRFPENRHLGLFLLEPQEATTDSGFINATHTTFIPMDTISSLLYYQSVFGVLTSRIDHRPRQRDLPSMSPQTKRRLQCRYYSQVHHYLTI